MQNKKIIVLGGSGFIGSHLIQALLSSGQRVVNFSRSNVQLDTSTIDSRLFSEELGDFANTSSVVQLVEPGDIIFDLVSGSVPASSLRDPLADIQDTIQLHAQFIDQAYQKGASKIIFFSSGGGVYGDTQDQKKSESAATQPVSPHAIGKLAIEYYLYFLSRKYRRDCLIYRISNPYGPNQQSRPGFGIVPTLFHHVVTNQPPVLFGFGELVRDYIFIDDLIKAILISFDKKNTYHLYNVGSGESWSLHEIWNMISDLTETPLQPRFEPMRMIDARSVRLDISRFSNEYEWSPKISIAEGLAQCWSMYYSSGT